MRALVKAEAAPGLWLQDVPKPQPGPGDVLIKVHMASICGTDMHIWKWDDWAQKTVPVPLVVGHEFVGRVEAVGADVVEVKPGDRVSGEGHLPCGHCRNCLSGRAHICAKTRGVGVNHPGAFADYLVIPEANVRPVPDEIPEEVAAILDPLGNAVHTALAFDLVGEDVLITGAGPIGLMAAAVCRHAGAHHVVVTDLNDERLALAESMGATRGVRREHGGDARGAGRPREPGRRDARSGHEGGLRRGPGDVRGGAGAGCDDPRGDLRRQGGAAGAVRQETRGRSEHGDLQGHHV
jgi:threonine 3-dehydrogenase